jgi:formylglycine-generating enzyme required for sulfatase activity
MTGNAWEWCRDWYGPYPSETVEGPTGAAKGTVRVIRGGSHRSEAGKLRAAYRANRPPNEVFDRCGFRIVWSEASDKRPAAS